MTDPVYVQYGCGYSCPQNWLNFDSSPSLRLERIPIIGRFIKVNETKFPSNVRYGDVVKGLPLPNDAAAGVYASHVLEHLSYEEFWKAIKETHRILRPGGIFRVVVPDLEGRARRYCAELETGNPEAHNEFMILTHLGRQSRPSGLIPILRSLLGGSAHLWMWDSASISEALRQTGFEGIRKAEFNDCEDSCFREVEEENRLFWSPVRNPELRFPECCIEARKHS